MSSIAKVRHFVVAAQEGQGTGTSADFAALLELKTDPDDLGRERCCRSRVRGAISCPNEVCELEVGYVIESGILSITTGGGSPEARISKMHDISRRSPGL